MQKIISVFMILTAYFSLSIAQTQAQLLADQKNTLIHDQFIQPQYFEMKAELDGCCYKGNQDFLSAEIHRKKVKPEYLQKIILENKRTRSAFTAMTFIINEQPISMNVLDDAFTTQHCTNEKKYFCFYSR